MECHIAFRNKLKPLLILRHVAVIAFKRPAVVRILRERKECRHHLSIFITRDMYLTAEYLPQAVIGNCIVISIQFLLREVRHVVLYIKTLAYSLATIFFTKATKRDSSLSWPIIRCASRQAIIPGA